MIENFDLPDAQYHSNYKRYNAIRAIATALHTRMRGDDAIAYLAHRIYHIYHYSDVKVHEAKIIV